MDESNKSQKIKLKSIKLSEILYKNKLRREIINHKTERINIKSRNTLDNLKIINPLINTVNTTSISKNRNPIANLKFQSPNKKNNLPTIIKLNIQKKEINEGKINSISLNKGYTNYLKEKTSKIYRRMKHLLLEERIKQLSLPKYKRINNIDNIRSYTYKNKNDKNNKQNDIDIFYQLNPNYKYKKHLHNNRLIQKEKMKARKRYHDILQINFKKLDSCESKFNSVIDRTMKLLSDYQHSIGFIKTEN